MLDLKTPEEVPVLKKKIKLETVLSIPMDKESVKLEHCVVVVDGGTTFYEINIIIIADY